MNNEEQITPFNQDTTKIQLNYTEVLIKELKNIGIPSIDPSSITIGIPSESQSTKQTFETEVLATKITQEQVIQAYLSQQRTPVTVKLIPLNIDLQSTVDELLNEISLLQNASHHSLPRLYGIIDTSDTLALVFNRVEGVSLDQLLYPKDVKSLGMVTIPFKLKIVSLLIDVLTGIHEKGFFHGDLKPSNIVMCESDSDCEHCKHNTHNNTQNLQSEGERKENVERRDSCIKTFGIDSLCFCRIRLVSFGEAKISSRTLTFTSAQMSASQYKAPEFFHIADRKNNREIDSDMINVNENESKDINTDSNKDINIDNNKVAEAKEQVVEVNKDDDKLVNEEKCENDVYQNQIFGRNEENNDNNNKDIDGDEGNLDEQGDNNDINNIINIELQITQENNNNKESNEDNSNNNNNIASINETNTEDNNELNIHLGNTDTISNNNITTKQEEIQELLETSDKQTEQTPEEQLITNKEILNENNDTNETNSILKLKSNKKNTHVLFNFDNDQESEISNLLSTTNLNNKKEKEHNDYNNLASEQSEIKDKNNETRTNLTSKKVSNATNDYDLDDINEISNNTLNGLNNNSDNNTPFSSKNSTFIINANSHALNKLNFNNHTNNSTHHTNFSNHNTKFHKSQSILVTNKTSLVPGNIKLLETNHVQKEKTQKNIKKKKKYSDDDFIPGVKSDIWALGCIMCEMFSGVKPWRNKCKDMIALERSLCLKKEFPVPEMSMLRDSGVYEVIAKEMGRIAGCCLEVNPKERVDVCELRRLFHEMMEVVRY